MTDTYQVGHNLIPTDIITSPTVRGTDIANITGDASQCGMTDVQGNIAFFNSLCVGTINGKTLEEDGEPIPTGPITACARAMMGTLQTIPNTGTLSPTFSTAVGEGTSSFTSDASLLTIESNGIVVSTVPACILLIVGIGLSSITTGDGVVMTLSRVVGIGTNNIVSTRSEATTRITTPQLQAAWIDRATAANTRYTIDMSMITGSTGTAVAYGSIGLLYLG